MEPEEAKGVLLLEQFKMGLRRKGGRVPLLQRSVHALGANVAVPLVAAVAKVLEAVASEAMDRLAALGVALADVAFVVTVPAIWDEEAKALMVEAAALAGIVGGASGVSRERLLLCLEPEGAIIASMVDATPELRRRLVLGSGVMVLDCGGGTVDVTVSELVGVEPYALKEVLPASGDAWGGTIVDAEARKLFNALLCPPGAGVGGRADANALAAVLDSWEAAKAAWDPEDEHNSVVKVGGLAAVCEAVGGAEAMSARVAAFNAANGLEGAAAVVYRPRAFALWLPSALVKGIFDVCVSPILAHMLALFAEANALGCPIGFVFLVGGFAESLYLQRSVRAALSGGGGGGGAGGSGGGGAGGSGGAGAGVAAGEALAELIVPHKPQQVVNRGSALWGLYPASFITSRISRYTYAVSLAERYNPSLHDPLPARSYLERALDGNVYCRNVLVPLVQRGDELPVDFEVQREATPLTREMSKTAFDLYRLDCRLPPAHLGLRRALVLDEGLEAPSEALRTLSRPAAGGGVTGGGWAGSTDAAGNGGGGGGGGGGVGGGGFLGGLSAALGFSSTSASLPALKQRRKRGASGGAGGTDAGDFCAILPIVHARNLLTTVEVDVVRDGSGDPLANTVLLFFGRTELVCCARSAAGQEMRVPLRFA
jgi:uncharacterized membrane protein YgcG